MSSASGLDYLSVFAITLVLTLFLTPLALRYALRRQILDHPGLHKGHDSPVPYLGGAAIVVSFAAVILAAALVRSLGSGLSELGIILGLAVLLGMMGLIDDLVGLSPWLRLTVEIGAATAVWATPAGAQVFDNDVLNLAITVAWLVGVTNALNLLDNMDGLSAGVAAVASSFLFIMAADNGQFLVATLAIALTGCALGFLRSNFHPARIYMGDAGSLFLGFMLATLSLKLRFLEAPRVVGLGVPLLVLGVPLFDTTLVMVNRLIHGRSPLSGGRDHTSHRLVFVGLPVPVSVGLLYLIAVSLGVLAVVVSRVDADTALLLLGWVGSVGVLLGVLFSFVPVYETSRRRHLMLQEVARAEPEMASDDDPDEQQLA